MIIGIAGDICSGKSTVSGEFRKLRAAVFDADKVAKFFLKKDFVKRKLFKICGEQIFIHHAKVKNSVENCQIDRKKLAEIIFTNPQLKKKVEKVIHPLVRKKMFAFIKKNKNKMVVLDVPLLFENGLHKLCDKVVFIKTRYSDVLKRLKKRKISLNDYFRRKKTQMDLNKKLKLCDYIIYNTGTLKNLKLQCKKLFKKIEEEQNEEKGRS